jgi:hypothetical protein
MTAIVRNGLIFLGIIAGGVLALLGFIREVDKPEEVAQKDEPAPIQLQTARPVRPEVVPLSGPASLDSGFGRTELTGITTHSVSANPLRELAFDRRFEVVLDAPPPPPPADLPEARAPDEVLEPEVGDSSLQEHDQLGTLSGEAAAHAEQGLVTLRAGTKMLKEGMNEFRLPGQEGLDGRRKIRESADILRDARDHLYVALRHAPGDPDLLRLMQETKANLYAAMKHGR